MPLGPGPPLSHVCGGTGTHMSCPPWDRQGAWKSLEKLQGSLDGVIGAIELDRTF